MYVYFIVYDYFDKYGNRGKANADIETKNKITSIKQVREIEESLRKVGANDLYVSKVVITKWERLETFSGDKNENSNNEGKEN